MERIRNWNRYQKVLAFFLCGMLLIFTVLYGIVTSRVGFAYKDKILLPEKSGESMVYAGRIKGEFASFTVTQDKTVTFVYGEKTYGPYTAQEDPSAIPEDEEPSMKKHMKGVEILCGDEVFFRGGVYEARSAAGKELWLFDEEDGFSNLNIYFTTDSGIMYDGDGNVVDQMEPSAYDILKLMYGPELESKGEWLAWFGGVFISAVALISMLFADELFRWNLRWVIRDADKAEPSEWEITSRYIAWTVSAIAALVMYIVGLSS